jgi:uncharacterized membrane protein YfcA
LSLWLYVVASAAGGIVVGVLGTGSSLILLPSLILIFGTAMDSAASLRLAAGTTMATMAVGAVSGAFAQYRAGRVDTQLLRITISPYVIGALAGAWVSRALPTGVLAIYVAALILVVALRMLFASGAERVADRSYLAHLLELRIVLTLIALGSSVAGIASGIFAIPYLLRFATPVRTVIGTSTACAAVFATAGAIGYFVAGLSDPNVPTGSIGYIYLPAFAVMATVAAITTPIGVRLAGRVREPVLKRCFALLLLAASVLVAFAR